MAEDNHFQQSWLPDHIKTGFLTVTTCLSMQTQLENTGLGKQDLVNFVAHTSLQRLAEKKVHRQQKSNTCTKKKGSNNSVNTCIIWSW